ncbi:MAG: NYN domain-containing protein [Deltaproteobacteria bacterium]|nr:NYN domain-containing protein [Deltaproteobacteria bacterium]
MINPTENNYAFIDSQNLNLSIQDQGWKLDWGKFRIYLKDKHRVTKAYFFIGFIPTNQSLYTSLQKDGYILIFKPTLSLPNGKPKGNVDAELVLHTILEINNYDKAVIVSGDGDYYCLVKHLKKENKLKSLVIPNRNRYSSLLREFSSEMAFVTDLKQKVEYTK